MRVEPPVEPSRQAFTWPYSALPCALKATNTWNSVARAQAMLAAKRGGGGGV